MEPRCLAFVECVSECACSTHSRARHRKELRPCLQGDGILVEEADTERHNNSVSRSRRWSKNSRETGSVSWRSGKWVTGRLGSEG